MPLLPQNNPPSALSTARLELRPRQPGDFDAVCGLATKARAMASLGGVRTAKQVRVWLDRELAQLSRYGYGRHVVTHQGELMGLVGLTRLDFDAGVVPGVEIAWQLAYAHWGKGFATEAARCILADAFTTHGLTEVIAVTSIHNLRSRRVMQRLGMRPSPSETFEHPHLAEGDPLRRHLVYRLRNSQLA